MSLQPCGSGYCGPHKSTIDGDCHDLDYQPGNKIVLQGDGIPHGRCWCLCSCLATNTPVAIDLNGGTIKVQDMVEDKTKVIAAGLDLEFGRHTVETFSRANPGTTHHIIYLKYCIAGEQEDREIILTRDHMMYLKNEKKFVPVDWISPKDDVVDRHGNVITIKEILWGSYDGDFFEFATDMDHPNDNLDGHLVVTNGLVTGDFGIQTWITADVEVRKKYLVSEEGRPVVGTQAWAEKYYPGHNFNDGPKEIDVNGETFIPQHGYTVDIPDDADQFLPDWQANFLEEYAPKKPFADTTNLQLLEYIEKNLKFNYPDVNFVTNWYSHQVNAFSWIDNTTGENKKMVYISGGLARIQGFDYEGVYFALAQQVGMFYGEPRNPVTGLGGAGVGDYYGAKIVLRKIWFYERYLENMDKVTKQLHTLFGYLKEEHKEKRSQQKAPPFPSVDCRFETIKAAEALSVIPECALCNS